MPPVPAATCLATVPTSLETRPETIRTIVVDDYPDAMETVCGLIDLEPFVEIVGRAGNGVDALAAIVSLQPELVIMDVNMPCLDGLTTTAILARLYPELCVILMSAEPSPTLRATGAQCGARGFLPKTNLVTGLPRLLRELFPGRLG